MEQLILHMIGDYVTQSSWMANNKTKRSWPCLVHATVYSLPFFLIASPPAVLVIWWTHFVIDRFRLARYVAYAKNFMAPRSEWEPWYKCDATGYHNGLDRWMTVWLLILCDNTIHLAINWTAIYCFPK